MIEEEVVVDETRGRAKLKLGQVGRRNGEEKRRRKKKRCVDSV
jgi:hypothetical protein